jgi:hypothetical protein
MQLEAIQTNDFDCGVWVLACIAAILRGYHVTGLHQENMVGFRDFLCRQILYLPCKD